MGAARPEDVKEDSSGGEVARRRRKLRLVAAVVGAIAVVDYLVLRFVVPWADEWHTSTYGSLGYVTCFILAFSNVIATILLIAYVFQGASYPSDRWQ